MLSSPTKWMTFQDFAQNANRSDGKLNLTDNRPSLLSLSPSFSGYSSYSLERDMKHFIFVLSCTIFFLFDHLFKYRSRIYVCILNSHYIPLEEQIKVLIEINYYRYLLTG